MPTENVIPLQPGLHGASLAAFAEVCALVDANIRRERAPLFDVRSETQLRQARQLLAYAVDVADAPYRNKINNDCVAPADEETAHSFVARAGNRLALAIHIGSVA